MALTPGDAVICANAHEVRVGCVVGIRQVEDLTLYDVAFERETLVGLLEGELRVATIQEVRAMLAGLAFEAQTTHPTPTDTSAEAYRDRLLRQEASGRLTEALRRMVEGDGHLNHASGRFAMGEVVAVCQPDGWSLARILTIALETDGLHYGVEVEGELERHAEGALLSLTDPSLPYPGIRLGQRARLASAGHDDDPEFEGTVCRISHDGEQYLLSLAFDDGDVFCDLTAADLIALND